ncbi:MAG: hypothetical protein WCK89_03900 [bacterium]
MSERTSLCFSSVDATLSYVWMSDMQTLFEGNSAAENSKVIQTGLSHHGGNAIAHCHRGRPATAHI